MPTYLERYLTGEHEQVWAELQALGERVREGPLRADAFGVAHETMRRVRTDIGLLIPRLEAKGYQFYAHPTEYGKNGDPPRLAMPDEDTRAQLDEIEREFGPLPISLRAFYEVVGAVNLVGEPPAEEGWRDGTALDPLFVYGLRTNYAYWRKVRTNVGWRADYRPRLFPDFLLKYAFSSVGPVEIKAPSADMDASLWFEDGEMYGPNDDVFLFVPYLRFALQHGGFPGMGRPSLDDSPIREELRVRLVEGLLPF